VGREERIVGGNPALHALLDEAGLSNAALARTVVVAGAETGIHVGTNTTSAKRMLDGSQPRWPVPKLVARVLSRHLNREVAVTECGFVDRDLSTDTFNGFGCATTIDGTIATVAELSGRDIKRRNFLLGSAFTAAAFAEPALLAVTMPPEASAAKAAGQRIGAADVEVTLNIVRQFAVWCGRGSCVSCISKPKRCGTAAMESGWGASCPVPSPRQPGSLG